MKTATLLTLTLLLPTLAAHAAESWESCLDDGDLNLNADVSFFKSVKVVKSGCLFRLTESEGKGRKLEVDVCDPNTKIADYATINAEKPELLYAGSGGCPAPLFGADIGPSQGTSALFTPAKAKVFEIFATVRKTFGPGADELNIAKLKSASAAGSEAKLACAKLLLDEYLGNCVSFTAKPAPVDPSRGKATAEEKLPPGVHPATIGTSATP
jgi:hypothetical protein